MEIKYVNTLNTSYKNPVNFSKVYVIIPTQ